MGKSRVTSKPRVAKTRNQGTQTEAGYIGWLKSLMRKGSMKWRPRNAVKQAARQEDKVINPATGRECWGVVCAECGKVELEKLAHMDHINPIVPIGKNLYLCGRDDFDPEKHICLAEMAENLYCEAEGWQVLCHDCHATKTAEERRARKK